MPHTLLLADDSVTIQRVIELTFADQDVSVVAVSDGDAAIAALTSSSPDIVLADIDMPGCSGYDIAEHVRCSPALSHIPVLLLAGALEPADESRARAVGSAGVLIKPFAPDVVIRRVNELLAQPKAVASSSPSDESLSPTKPQPHTAALDDYFAQLDQAIAARAAAPVVSAPSFAPSSEEPLPIEDEDPARPLLASAFSALLDAERSGSDTAPLPGWMTTAASPSSAGSAPITDDLVERIVHRVIERMSDRIVRETVASVVSTTAERLVAEEIERIKSNIK